MVLRKLGLRNLVLGTVLIGLAGCSSDLGEVFGYQRGGPDEFAVVKRAPLTLPPDFGLRAPDPGAEDLNVVTPRNTARKALFGNDLTPRQKERLAREQIARGNNPAEVALLSQANALNTDPSIRRVVDDESASLARESEGFVDELLFWKESPEAGAVVDADGELRRLQENASLGKPSTDGETPTIYTQEEEPLFKWPF